MQPTYRRRLSFCLASILVAVTTAQPALATEPTAPPPDPAPVAPAPAPTPPPPPPAPPHEGADTIAARLVDLGWSEADAAIAAAELTPADLDVLLENPEMMQNAGASSTHTAGILVGVLLLGGLIALAWAGDGSISFSSS
ncbi:MAG: hypothetical protein ACYTGG_06510 [Planctomycetota bacterium]|jgi:hypothetical protein